MLSFLESLLIRAWSRRAPSVRHRREPAEPALDDDAIGYTLPSGEDSGRRPQPVHLQWSDLQRMTMVAGITGAGKSNFIKVVLAIVSRYASIVSLDLSGDINTNWALPFAAATFGPDDPQQRLAVIDPSLPTDYITPINPLQAPGGPGDPVQRGLRVHSVIRKHAQDQFGSWGVDISQNLMYLCLALAVAGTYSLLDAELFMTNVLFREHVLSKCSAPIRDYWLSFFAGLSEDKQRAMWPPLQNKLSGLLLPLRDLLGPRKGFSFDILNERPGMMVLCTLPEYRLGDAAAAGMDLLTAMLTDVIFVRAEIAPEKRLPCLIVVDEFPQLDTSRFDRLLSLARKTNTAILLGTQSPKMVPSSTRVVLRDVIGNTVAMRVGADSAADLARSIIPADPHEDVRRALLALRQGEGFLAQVDKPAVRFRVRKAPEPDVAPEIVQATLETALRNYGQPRSALATERAQVARLIARLERKAATAAASDDGEVIADEEPGRYKPRKKQ